MSDKLDTLRNVIADEEGFNKVMGPLLGTLIRNSLIELLQLREQIEKRGFAIGNIDKIPHFVHKKTENTYLLLTVKNVRIEKDWQEGTLYTRLDEEDGPLIVRNKEEFHDGRFEALEEDASGSAGSGI